MIIPEWIIGLMLIGGAALMGYAATGYDECVRRQRAILDDYERQKR